MIDYVLSLRLSAGADRHICSASPPDGVISIATVVIRTQQVGELDRLLLELSWSTWDSRRRYAGGWSSGHRFGRCGNGA